MMTEDVNVPSKEELQAILNGEEGAALDDEGAELTSEGFEQEYSEIELQAIEHGWNPEGVEGKRNLSAEEFMDRQPLYDEMRNLKKQARKLEEGMDAMRKMQEGIREREREKTIKELQQKKLEALEDGNYNAVIEIDDAIAEEKVNKDTQAVNNHQFEEWVDNNEWYNQDPDLRKYADTLGSGYFATNPNAEPKEVFNYVETEVKARYPEKFGNPRRKAPAPVEGASRGRGQVKRGASKHKASELPEQDRQIMRTILRTGKMSEAEYLKEYFGE
jgi:hypothetical protein